MVENISVLFMIWMQNYKFHKNMYFYELKKYDVETR